MKDEAALTKGLTAKELKVLAEFSGTESWDVFRKLLRNSLYDTVFAMASIQAEDPHLAIKKARYEGMRLAIKKIDKRISGAKKEFEKMVK